MTKDQLEELSLKFKEAHAVHAVAKRNLDGLKSEIKEEAGNGTIENQYIKLSHNVKHIIDYQGMIEDSGITIPERYKSERVEVRLTIVKQKKESKTIK